MEAVLDRVKMAIYTNFAQWGLPCPITGQEAVIGAEAIKKASPES
jgi:cytochrome c heme-lyase